MNTLFESAAHYRALLASVNTPALPSVIMQSLDLTSLQDNESEKDILTLCEKAKNTLGTVAAICIYPKWISLVKKHRPSPDIKIATVVNFHSGNDSLSSVLALLNTTIDADEIDVVFPYEAYLKGDIQYCRDFLSAVRNACKHQTLKVILETGAFPDYHTLFLAAYDAIAAGADFLKTSTGKIPVGASLDSALCLLHAIQTTQKPVGLKISGGVRTPEVASHYIALAQKMMGEDFISPITFRIGASGLLDTLLSLLPLREKSSQLKIGEDEGY
jgi:deoxyribose-phosphate aldolase